MSLSIRQNLGSREAADAFNQRVYESKATPYSGCIGELACVHCYHVISDSICLCIGRFTCPKCGKENGRKMSDVLVGPLGTVGLWPVSARPKWTKTPPTVPGHYWLRLDAAATAEEPAKGWVVEVYQGLNCLWWRWGANNGYPMTKTKGIWCGPLEEPIDP